MDANQPSTFNHRQIVGLALLLIIYYLPSSLLMAQVIQFNDRFKILIIMTVVMICYMILRRHTLKEMGFRTDTLKGSLISNAGLSAILIASMYIALAANLIRRPTVPDWKYFYFFYVFISSPAQEFLFRSTIFAELNRAKIMPPFFQVLLSALTYCFVHIFYNDPLTLGVTLLMGLLWGTIYYKYPNFWGVAFSHAILGAVSIQVGLI